MRELTTDGDQLRLYVEDGSAALPACSGSWIASRSRSSPISLSEPTLDDVFLHQTGRSLRDAGTNTTETAA